MPNKANKMIPYARQDIDELDVSAVISALTSEYLTQGPIVDQFEKNIADLCGAKYCVSVNSATNALHIACLALEVGVGDIVWTSAITFVASSNCALYCGAKVDFVDIDKKTFNISIEALEDKLVHAKKNGQLPKVVIAVHMGGQSCEMDKIYDLSVIYGFNIIEDASHALGGKYKNNLIGNGKYSDITVFSFHPVKIITTGEGGAVVTNNKLLEEKMRLLRSHGITSEPIKMISMPSDELWNYQQIALGFNYRLTDLQAALGISQLKKLDQFILRRHEIADIYNNNLKHLPLEIPWQHPDTYSSYHLYIIRLNTSLLKKSQVEIFKELRSQGIFVNLHYIPVYRHPFYRKLGFQVGYCPEAEKYFKGALSIPMFPRLTNQQQFEVIDKLNLIIN